jgi:hypothetical protein
MIIFSPCIGLKEVDGQRFLALNRPGYGGTPLVLSQAVAAGRRGWQFFGAELLSLNVFDESVSPARAAGKQSAKQRNRPVANLGQLYLG